MLNETQHILDRLAAADRQHQKEAGGRFLLRAVRYLCAFLLAAFILDVALHLSGGWRLGLLLALVGATLVLAAVASYLALIRRNRLEYIARFLEDRHAALGSRLINLLQLRGQAHDPALPPLTRDLARQAVEGYAAELRATPLERLAVTGELRRHCKRAALALLAFAAVLGAFFRITAVEAARFADPFGDHPPYSFTRLEIVNPGPAGTNLLYGKGLVVRVKTAGHKPKDVFLTSFPPGHPERAVTVPMFDKGGQAYDQLLDHVRSELVLFAHTRDRTSVSKQARIGLILTPKLEQAFVQVSPPPYTGLKPEEKPYDFKTVQALEGSQVRFRLRSNRPLREGALEVTGGERPPQRVALTNTAESEVAGVLVPFESSRLRFTLADVAGTPSQDDWQGPLTVTHDLPPEIRITEPERDSLVAVDFKLQAHVEAGDDYGLRSVRIHRGINGVFGEPKVIAYDTIVRNCHEVLDFDFARLGVKPGDVVSVFAEAVDTAPKPHLARSQTLRLLVISVEDYNNFLREQTDLADLADKYEGLMEELQNLVEDQKKLGETAEKLKAQLAAAASARAREDLARQLDDLLAKQNELNHKLNQHADRLEHFVRQDPLYDVEQELQEILGQEADTIRASARDNSAAAGDIARRSSPPAGVRQLSPDLAADFKQASDEQLARLGGVQAETREQVADTLEDMSQMQELQKDFSQFEALYRAQKELASQAQAYDRAGQLSREDQLALKELAATEKQVGELLDQLAEKLRQDARAAEALFPKAARSGQDLADRLEELRLSPLARQATGQMLAGNGERSFRLADRVRSEMEKLFGECQGGNCPSGSELDAYLKLQRAMNPGKNFAQMARSRKFGGPKGQGLAMGMGMGEGASGAAGFAVLSEPNLQVMGNEQAASRGQAAARQASRYGKGAGELAGRANGLAGEKADVMKGLKPVNRQSGAVASETVIEEYSDLVDNYFKAITTRQTQ
jgi:hypothetical protein